MAEEEKEPVLEIKTISFFNKNLGAILVTALQLEGWSYVGSSFKDNETILRFIKKEV